SEAAAAGRTCERRGVRDGMHRERNRQTRWRQRSYRRPDSRSVHDAAHRDSTIAQHVGTRLSGPRTVMADHNLPVVGRRIALDCRFFLGDRPCIWHKRTGVLCTCDAYAPIEERVLIIKLDAMGDVLRSTALLAPLAEVHPRASMTWITRKESVPLLQRNPYVTEVLEFGPEALAHLQTRTFDRVVNLDASKTSAALASAAQSTQKDGFVLDPRGYVQPTNEAARRWLEAGVFDDIKRQGRLTYQDRMADILGLAGRRHRYVFELSDEERAAASVR